jgi:type II secretory pathway component PulF
MPYYTCRVASEDGAVRVEKREGSDADAVARGYAQAGAILLSVELVEEAKARRRAFSDKVVLEFTKVLAVLLQAGLPLEAALEIARDSFQGQRAEALANLLRERLLKGDSFSRSLDESGASITPVYRGLVRIGERTGQLEAMFIKVASYLEERKRLIDKIQGALVYPALVLGVVVLMLVGIALFLVPGLRGLFGGIGTALPPQTAAALDTLGFLSWSILVTGVLIALAALALRRIRRRGGALAIRLDRYAFRLPLLGRYLLLSESLSFSFALETLVASGISLEDAITEGTGVLRNKAMIADLEKARGDIIAGDSLSRAFSRCASLPKEFSRWAMIGERTGSVESIFAQTRVYFQYAIDTWTSRFMSLVEPALIVTVGGILITIIILFIVPFLTSFTAVL